jgi:hypothetical protein
MGAYCPNKCRHRLPGHAPASGIEKSFSIMINMILNQTSSNMKFPGANLPMGDFRVVSEDTTLTIPYGDAEVLLGLKTPPQVGDIWATAYGQFLITEVEENLGDDEYLTNATYCGHIDGRLAFANAAQLHRKVGQVEVIPADPPDWLSAEVHPLTVARRRWVQAPTDGGWAVPIPSHSV